MQCSSSGVFRFWHLHWHPSWWESIRFRTWSCSDVFEEESRSLKKSLVGSLRNCQEMNMKNMMQIINIMVHLSYISIDSSWLAGFVYFSCELKWEQSDTCVCGNRIGHCDRNHQRYGEGRWKKSKWVHYLIIYTIATLPANFCDSPVIISCIYA